MNESKTVTELVSNVKRKVFNERQKARSSVKKNKKTYNVIFKFQTHLNSMQYANIIHVGCH